MFAFHFKLSRFNLSEKYKVIGLKKSDMFGYNIDNKKPLKRNMFQVM